MLSSLMVGVYHPRRSIRASASVDTCIRVGRHEHPRRSIRASASVVTSICVGRRGWWG
ncbi:hypothetical protein [Leyella stercorea]|uniref:hypothetical protein n=1 Tax=Leyella stercorea TaxID=363265 RepID=UPI003FF10093